MPTFAEQVVAALSTGGDVFLRTSHPLTEPFALLAMKARAYSEAQAAAAADLFAPTNSSPCPECGEAH